MKEGNINISNRGASYNSNFMHFDGKSNLNSSKMMVGIAIFSLVTLNGLTSNVNKASIAKNLSNKTYSYKDVLIDNNDYNSITIPASVSLNNAESIELDNSTLEVTELTKVTQTQLEEVKEHIDTKLEKLEASIDAKLEKSKNELKNEILKSQNEVLQKIESSKKEQTNTRHYWIGLGVQVLITVLTLIVTKLFHIY